MSSNNRTVVRSGGVGFFGLLFITFLVLKLTEVVDWSWWWITAPLWAPFLALLLILIVVFIILFFVMGKTL